MLNNVNQIKLVSFDIFDTTLIRKCGFPNNVFYILSKKLFPDNFSLQKDFYNWRIHVEDYYNTKTKVEPDLYRLYDLLPSHLGQFYSAKQIAELEKKTEIDNLVANSEIKAILGNYRDKGYTICFISDMYLDSNFLTSVLINLGCAVAGEKVFVSNEYNKRKDIHGELYSVIRNYYPNTKEWIHYGDNYESDYKCAKKKGIVAIHYKTDFSPSEREMLIRFRDYSFSQELSVLIGFQRCCRLSMGNSPDISNASDLIASLYIPYLFHIYSLVKNLKIQSLYFLSRDANIFYELAKCFFSEQLNIDIHYLYVSRKALINSCFETLSKNEILELLGKKTLIGEYVSSILSSLQISRDLLDNIDFEKFQSEEDENSFFEIIRKKRVLIIEENKNKRIQVLEYLKQEGFLDSTGNVGIVDVGWIGTTRLILNRLKDKYGKKGNVSFFYLGFESAVLYSDKGNYYSFFPKSVNDLSIPYFTELIENYYSAALHTSTIGYYSKDNHIRPVLEDNPNEEVQTLAKNNIEVCKTIFDYINSCLCLDFSASYNVWGIGFLKLFADNPRLFYTQTFEKVYYYNRKFFKKVSLMNLFRFFISGSTGLDCIDEFSIYCTYGIRIKRKYTLFSVHKIINIIINRFL